MLVPTLQPGDVAVLDNLAVHEHPAIQAAITQAGASLRSLPLYSPDFNPIEQVFAKLKTIFRVARPRSFDDVCALLRAALGLFSPTEYPPLCWRPVPSSRVIRQYRVAPVNLVHQRHRASTVLERRNAVNRALRFPVPLTTRPLPYDPYHTTRMGYCAICGSGVTMARPWAMA